MHGDLPQSMFLRNDVFLSYAPAYIGNHLPCRYSLLTWYTTGAEPRNTFTSTQIANEEGEYRGQAWRSNSHWQFSKVRLWISRQSTTIPS